MPGSSGDGYTTNWASILNPKLEMRKHELEKWECWSN
jgi:hypothetical protein